MSTGEYAQAGVSYQSIDPFKQTMAAMGRRTLAFPNWIQVEVESGEHGATFYYYGRGSHRWSGTQEGLGNKNWIAEWMAMHAGTGRSYYEGIGTDTALMAVNDNIADGSMPIMYMDEVAAGDSEWFENVQRREDLAESFFQVCQLVGMALPAGESPSLRYLIKAEPPVRSAPSLSGSVVGIIVPASSFIQPGQIKPGLSILGVTSSGLHANGISLVIKRALALPDKFLTKLPNGSTLGDEALIPTRSYVALTRALYEAGVNVKAYLPGTGSGIGKVAFDKRPMTYRIHTWVKVPELFQFMRELGVSLKDCLETFNWGIGYYVFVEPREVAKAIDAGTRVGYEIVEVGRVEEGERKVIFEPEDGIEPAPPGE